MNIIHGDLWTTPDKIILATGNSTLKKDGSVVMGRGAAKEMRDRFPDIDKEIGKLISHRGVYGLVLVDRHPYTVGLFQVKTYYYNIASLDIIKYSIGKLLRLGEQKISMNFPGIGNGRLSFDEVYAVVKELPDNVSLYIKER